MTEPTKPPVADKVAQKRKFEVAPGYTISLGHSLGQRRSAGTVVELTAAEFKLFPKGALLPFVEGDEEQ